MSNYETQPGKRLHQRDAVSIVANDMRETIAQQNNGEERAKLLRHKMLIDLISRNPSVIPVIFNNGKEED